MSSVCINYLHFFLLCKPDDNSDGRAVQTNKQQHADNMRVVGLKEATAVSVSLVTETLTTKSLWVYYVSTIRLRHRHVSIMTGRVGVYVYSKLYVVAVNDGV